MGLWLAATVAFMFQAEFSAGISVRRLLLIDAPNSPGLKVVSPMAVQAAIDANWLYWLGASETGSKTSYRSVAADSMGP